MYKRQDQRHDKNGGDVGESMAFVVVARLFQRFFEAQELSLIHILDVFRVFAENDHVHFFRSFDGSFNAVEIAHGTQAVSYTHLDVYKRQLLR